jgi:hypothetical protein
MVHVESNHELPTTATRVLPLCCTTIYDYNELLICKYKLAQPARAKIKMKEKHGNKGLTTMLHHYL